MDPADADDVLTRAAAPPDAVLRYAGHDDGVIDVHLPAGDGPHPLVVLFHGGFWKQAYDRVHVRPMARALVEAGCVVAAPEYRRVGGRGGWPTTGEDVAAAFVALPDLLDWIGVTSTTTTVTGHSAGGHLALWLVGTERRPRIDRLVALAPVGDLQAAARDGLGGGATQALLGGSPERAPEAYADADPMNRIEHADPSTEIVVLHGIDDDAVPVEHSRGLARQHPRVRLHELPGGHFELIDPASAVWPDVEHELLGGRPRHSE